MGKNAARLAFVSEVWPRDDDAELRLMASRAFQGVTFPHHCAAAANGERLQTKWCWSDLIRWRRFTAFRPCSRSTFIIVVLGKKNTLHVMR